MNEPSRLSGREITDLLRRRSARPVPDHLAAAVLDSLASERALHPARSSGRSGRRWPVLLAAAAVLLVGGAVAAGSGILRLPTVVPPVPDRSVIAVATASPDATSPSPSESAAPSASPIPVAGPGGVWIPTGSMVMPSADHTAVRLLDGRVLVVGGENGAGDGSTSAQLYDPANGTWSATADWSVINGAKAVLLRDGKVLVGESVYDPASETWTSTDSGAAWAAWHFATVTALRDGKALVTRFDDARLYDPATGTWAATGKTIVPRDGAAATLLSDGKVLVAGGTLDFPDTRDLVSPVDKAEVYDPVTGSWTAIADMPAPARAAATLLRDGRVLVTGFQGVAEVYDPATGSWAELPVTPGINFSSAVLLSDGTVLLTGGGDPAQGCVTVNLYDPRTGSWTTVSGIPWCRVSSFTPLLDGTVLVAGGSDCNDEGNCVSNGAAALYVPAGVSLPSLPAFPTPAPPVFPTPAPLVSPSPTPTPAPVRPPAAGPVPPNARSWTITVDNRSSGRATLFVAEGDDGGTFRLVGSATPNVVPAGATMKVTFLFPAKGPDDGWITVNPRLDEGADVGSVGADNIGMPGKILITENCGGCWVGPAQ